MTDYPDQQCAVLAQNIRMLVGKLKRRMREQGGVGDLTPSQIAVLAYLEKNGPATTSHLARAEAMRPQSMGTVIAALESAGMVQKSPDPLDGRKTILSLTVACRKLIGEGHSARQDWLMRTIEARLSRHEQDQLASMLSLLDRIIAE